MALKSLNSVAGFSVGETPANIILANGDITTNNFSTTGKSNLNSISNVYISGGSVGQVIQTDGLGNLSFVSASSSGLANGNSNIQILANANITFSSTGNANIVVVTGTGANVTGYLTVAGNAQFSNANLGNLATANYINVSSNITVTNLVANTNVDFTGASNVSLGAVGNVHITGGSGGYVLTTDGSGNLSWAATGSPTIIQNGNSNVSVPTGNGNVYINSTGAEQWVFTTTGNTTFPAAGAANLGNAVYANFFIGSGNNLSNIQGGNVSGEVANANYATYAGTAYSVDGGNVSGQVGNALIAGTVYTNAQPNITSVGTLASLNVSGTVSAGDISTTGAAGDITMSGGNITGANNISANSANFSGNITSLNADLGNLATANYINVANDLNVLGNITGSNFIGSLANGTSNVKVYQDANVEITVGGVPNTATFSSTGLYVDGEINSTAGNILSNGNVTANSFLNSANANVTGQANVGSLLTSNITATTGVITISAAGTNQNIVLNPSGTGNVDVGLHHITQVGAPVNPNDAATKEYVDNISQGLFIHPPANVTSLSNLTATYLVGGTSLSVDSITGNKTITFSANHGLLVNDDIEFTNSFNGLIGGEQYFVYSTPTLDSITVKDGYNGGEVTTLTNGTTLAEPATGNAGVGATLTNSGTQVALTIDSILMTVGKRVLVQGQTNQYENGIYDVTTVGTISTNWVLTRSSDGDSYQPKSDTALCSGSYFFITQGTQYAGSSYVLTSPTGEINIGTSNIVFTQFSKSGTYTAGGGINITGTIISANTDGVTTDILGGNIVVKASANLTTPNIGDATFSSLGWNNLSNGNVTANNLSIGNIANITGNLRVDGLIQSNGNVTSNAYINGNNAYFTNFANIGGNLLADYITSNHTVFTSNANVSGTTITNALTVNLNITGNTANFSGNVSVPVIYQNASTYDTRVSLDSATGLVLITSNSNSTQFGPGGQITLGGASQIVGGTFEGSQLQLDTTQTNLKQLRGGNVTVQVGTGGTTAYTWTFAQDGSFTSPGNISSLNANLGNLATANYVNVSNQINGNTANFTGNVAVGNLIGTNLTANSTLFIGTTSNLTQITSGNVTTSSIAANQTIASLNVAGITGAEFLVKSIDSGGKYSVATVQAVTDGTSVDYAVFGTVQLGGYTGSLVVNIVGGSYLRLQVTPSSSNSTVWVTQARTI